MDLSLQADADLRPFNTLALPARAAWLATLAAPEQLPALRADARCAGRPRLVLGGGSNLVLCGDLDALVLRVALAGRALAGEDAGARYVRAGAGENWHDFVQWTLACGWPGLENLALIPGSVGAAPIQNIGAYGLEAGERIAWVEAFDFASGETRRFDAADCRFGYRDSVFKQQGWHLDGRFVITGVTFRLPRQWAPRTGYAELARELEAQELAAPTPQQVADAVTAIRRRKLPDPAVLPNAGSFFQNPIVDAALAATLRAAHPTLPCYAQADGRVKLAAGWLIEQAGWKGRDLGPVGMYEKQALVLVNRGGARGADVLALARAVQADVRRRFGVELEPEPVRVGASA